MFYVRHADRYVLRFEDGERFPTVLLEFLREQGIEGGDFTAIGAMQRTTLAYFDTAAKEYIDRELDEQVEVLALLGNVAMYDDAPIVHAHIVLGRRDYSVIGGHLREGTVRPTLELTLRAGPPLRRALDPAYGLPALDLETRY